MHVRSVFSNSYKQYKLIFVKRLEDSTYLFVKIEYVLIKVQSSNVLQQQCWTVKYDFVYYKYVQVM